MVHLDLPEGEPKGKLNRRVTRENSDLDTGLIDQHASYDELLGLVGPSPLRAAHGMRQRLSRSRAEHEAELLNGCRLAYAAAVVLKKDTIMWSCLVKDPFWQGYKGHKPSMGKIGDHLRWLLILVFNPEDDLAKARVNMYRGALQSLFDDGGEPSEIAAYVKANGGLDELYKKSRGNSGGETTEVDSGQNRNAVGGMLGFGEAQVSSQPNTTQVNTTSSATKAKRQKFQATPTLKSEEKKRDRERLDNLKRRAIEIENTGQRAVLVAMKQSDLDAVAKDHVHRGQVGAVLELSQVNSAWTDITCERLVEIEDAGTLVD